MNSFSDIKNKIDTREEPEAKFSALLSSLKDTYNARVVELQNEVQKWKSMVESQKKQSVTLEVEYEKSKKRILQLEIMLKEQVIEKEKILKESIAIKESYDSLRQQALYLQKFKKSIVSMIESEDTLHETAAPHFDDAKNSFAALEISKSSSLRKSRDNVIADRINTSKDTHILQTNQSTDAAYSRTNISTISKSLNDTAFTLYKEIKAVLSVQDFNLFANYINQLNNGDITVEKTLELVGRILKEPSLFERLKRLIEDAST